MPRSAAVAAAMLVALTVACGGESDQSTAPNAKPSFSVTSPTPLSVVITAQTDLFDPDVPPPTSQTLPIKATASGGSGAYTFKWLKRICNHGPTSNYCEPTYSNEPGTVTTSGNTSTANHTFIKSDYITYFVVEVQDAAVAGGPSGVDSVKVTGPATAWGPGSGGSIYFTCDLGGNYPLTDAVTKQNYRRNPCTLAVETQN